MLEAFNQAAFGAFNAPAAPNPQVLFLARIFAVWLLYLAALGLVVGWVRGGTALRRAVFFAGLSAIAGLVVNQLIISLWYHPRPFEVGVGHQFLAHKPETSFPSDHGTIMFAIAFSLLAAAGARFWGWIALLAALAVAWARVYLGVHWPLDMAGSVAVAALAVWIVRRGLKKPTQKALVILEWIYERGLILLHLPKMVFPRSGRRR